MNINNLLPRLFDYRNISKFNFVVLFFFTLFGTGIPEAFGLREGTAEVGSSNIVNQLLYSSLFITSSLIVLIKYNAIFSFLSKEKYLTLFIGWCLLSILWSNYPEFALRRSFQYFVVFLVMVTSILFIDYYVLRKLFINLIFIYISATILSIIFLPGAIDPLFGTLRGLTYQKNLFGQIFNIIFLLLAIFYPKEKNSLHRTYHILLMIVSVLFIILSGSSTSIISFILILFVFTIFQLDKIFSPLKIPNLVSFLSFLFIFVFNIIASFYADEILGFIFGLFGKDITLTGRTEHWAGIWHEIEKHYFLGTGFGSFWDIPGGPSSQYVWNSAHSGYIEIINELGFIGLFLFIVLIIAFFKRSIRINLKINIVAMIAVLTLNLTESTLIKNTSSNFLLFWVYLSSAMEYFHIRSNK